MNKLDGLAALSLKRNGVIKVSFQKKKRKLFLKMENIYDSLIIKKQKESSTS
jgi:hypothetical protein